LIVLCVLFSAVDVDRPRALLCLQGANPVFLQQMLAQHQAQAAAQQQAAQAQQQQQQAQSQQSPDEAK
jgi:hypothetical protein